MKNIHILTTNKPSRILRGLDGIRIFENEVSPDNEWCVNVNIHITNDEEIKDGDKRINNYQRKLEGEEIPSKKIILTTDQDLIKDGVQAIDDEFLEWFVKNPSCEFVEVKCYSKFNDGDFSDYKIFEEKLKHINKIIIPKEENHSNIDSLIGKKVIWDSKEYTIIDKHNDSDFITIDDKNNSIVGLHWDNVCISKEETNYTMELNPHIGPFLLKNGFSKQLVRPNIYRDNVYYNLECTVKVLEDCYEIQFEDDFGGEVTTYTDSWSIPHLVGTLTWNDLIDRNYIK